MSNPIYVILYNYRHPLGHRQLRAHIETFDTIEAAAEAQKDVGDHFKAPTVIIECEAPQFGLYSVNDA